MSCAPDCQTDVRIPPACAGDWSGSLGSSHYLSIVSVTQTHCHSISRTRLACCLGVSVAWVVARRREGGSHICWRTLAVSVVVSTGLASPVATYHRVYCYWILHQSPDLAGSHLVQTRANYCSSHSPVVVGIFFLFLTQSLD